MSGMLMIFVAVLCSAAASCCLKIGPGAGGAAHGVFAMAVQPMMLGAMVLYAGSFGTYALALRKIPLTLAQPTITAGASILTALVAVTVLDETMSRANWCGLALVCVGIALLAVGKI